MPPTQRSLVAELATWIVTSIILFLLFLLPVMTAAFLYFKTYREPGWGTIKQTFPVLILTRRADGRPEVHIVFQQQLADFLQRSPDATFLIPAGEHKEIDRQLSGMRAEEGGEGKFEMLDLAVDDRPDGSQRVHLTAMRYEDIDNESWYIARPKSFQPLYHRYNLGIGVAGAAAFSTPMPAAILAILGSSAITIARRGGQRPSAVRTAEGGCPPRAMRRIAIALAIYAVGLFLVLQSSDRTWRNVIDGIVWALLIVAIVWILSVRREWRLITAVVVALAAADLWLMDYASAGMIFFRLAGVSAAVAILIATSWLANRIYEGLVAM